MRGWPERDTAGRTSAHPIPPGGRGAAILGRLSLILALITMPPLAAQSPPSPPPVEPPRIRPSDGTELTPEVLAFLEARLEEARSAYAAGNFHAAWQIAEAILVLAPSAPFEEELRRLRRDAQGRYLARSVIVVAFEPETDGAIPIEELRGNVVIENHSADVITIGSDEKEPVFGLVRFRVGTQGEVDLGEEEQAGTRVVRMPKEFRIEPGTAHRLPVSIPVLPPTTPPLVQRWRVDGVLRPITVRLGRERVTRGIPWLAASDVVVREDLSGVEDDPLGGLRSALLTGDRPRFIAAAALWWAGSQEGERGPIEGEDRERLIGELLSALGRFDGALDIPAIRLLEGLTGEVRERSARAWQIWGLTRARTEER